MGGLAFLAIAAGVFVLGALVVLLRHRDRRLTFHSSIERFRDEMGALGPGHADRSRRRTRRH